MYDSLRASLCKFGLSRAQSNEKTNCREGQSYTKRKPYAGNKRSDHNLVNTAMKLIQVFDVGKNLSDDLEIELEREKPWRIIMTAYLVSIRLTGK